MSRGTIRALLFLAVLALVACGGKPVLTPMPSPTSTLTPAPLSIYFATKDTTTRDGPPPLPYQLMALNASDGTVRWSRQGSSQQMRSILEHGVLYSGDTGVSAINARTGAALWHYQGDTTTTVVAVGDGMVYAIETSPFNNQSLLFALDASTGKQLWRSNEALEKPVVQVSGELLYVVNFGLSSTNPAYALMAYDARSGKQLWRFPTGRGNVIFEFAASGDTVYAQVTGEDLRSYLAVLNAHDGSLRWRFPQFAHVGVELQGLGPGLVYARSWDDESMYALSASDGSVKWQARVGTVASAVLANDTLYLSASNGTIYALDANTGVVRWERQAGQQKSDFDTLVRRVRQGVLYVSQAYEGIYALNIRDGTILWRNLTGDFSAQVDLWVLDASNGLVYVQGLDDTQAAGDTLYALSSTDGTERWRYHVESNTVSGFTLG